MQAAQSQPAESLWVLGHRIRPWDTDDSYGLVEVTSPAGASGPPPHYHDEAREFFLILKGALDVMDADGWKTATPGTFIELAPGAVHTFANRGTSDAVWITGWRPKGFQGFFRAFGIPAGQEQARERSVSSEIIEKALRDCGQFGMYLSK